MSDTDSAFTGSIPDVYDEIFVPLIFTSYAADLAGRVAALSPVRVLETAAGSGAVTRALAPQLGAGASYVVTDLNPPMLERAKKRQPEDARIAWKPADALALPFGDDAFDVVLCQFGVMFFPDRVAGYREVRRVLRRGGSFVFNVWDRLEENEFALAACEAMGRIFPDNPAEFMRRVPHGYHDTAQIRRDLEAAGFTDIEVHTIAGRSRAETVRPIAVAFCQGTPIRSALEALAPGRLAEITERVEADLGHRYGKGAVTGQMQAHVISARA